ncbi:MULTISPECIES: cytochrome c oxidase assembly protein [unclassified Pseudonocardia]|uniref:cytochrome c oxidase assembly protein n=1 Tax=unclassified Pseudonocardia TaxID=2619320 RepID=UPI0009597D73|nr:MULTISPECIES: cytochrome c oxidase assembly protein [unclassified Pseudonocardia]MBN9098009.1 cytochrome c oxidase assembly protein [Pseudonocardia sp.]OJY54412.1 MAG: hypothetical protein BGP03_23015 [Pseudonocardia sp. 73-21]
MTTLAFMPPADQPPLTVLTGLTSWTWDPYMLVPLAAAAVAYLWGVRVLRRRGDVWEPKRVAYWLLGLAIVLLGTSSMLGVYDRTLFWVPAMQHMLLQMIAPVPLVLGAPMTLALRTLPPRWRAVLLAVVHCPPARFIAHPVVAFMLFAATQFAFYYTRIYDLSLTNVWVHDLTHVHFVLIGFLFYWSLIGLDPVPHRPPFVLTFFLVVGLGPVHILLGIPIMMMNTLLGGGYYESLDRTWGPTLLGDQNLGGGILWGFGDVSAAVLVAAFAAQWYRTDRRDAVRTDRALDRIYGDSPTMTPWWVADATDRKPSGSS